MGNICTVSKGQLKILPLSLPLLFALLRIHVRNSSQPQLMVIPFLQSMDFPNPWDTIASYITMVSNQFSSIASASGVVPKMDGKMMRIPWFFPQFFQPNHAKPNPNLGE